MAPFRFDRGALWRSDGLGIGKRSRENRGMPCERESRAGNNLKRHESRRPKHSTALVDATLEGKKTLNIRGKGGLKGSSMR